MEISFDPAKDQGNQKKHGISLGEAARLDWNAMRITPDVRHEYGEDRWIGYAPLDNRLYCVVFVERDAGKRIISLRKANNREIESYETQP